MNRSRILILCASPGALSSLSRAIASLSIPEGVSVVIEPTSEPIPIPPPPSLPDMRHLISIPLGHFSRWPSLYSTREPSTKWRDFTLYLSRFRGPEALFTTAAKFISVALTPRKWSPRPRDQRDRARFFGRQRIAACFLVIILITPALLTAA